MRNLYDGVTHGQVTPGVHPRHALIEKDPGHLRPRHACCCTPSCARCWGVACSPARWAAYMDHFPSLCPKRGGQRTTQPRPAEHLPAPRFAGRARPQFDYLGLQTLYDRFPTCQQGPHRGCRRRFIRACAMGWRCAKSDRKRARHRVSITKLSSLLTSCRPPTLFNAARCARSCPSAT